MAKMDVAQMKAEIRQVVLSSLLTSLDFYAVDVLNEEHRAHFKSVVEAKTDYLMKCVGEHVELYIPKDYT